MRVVFIENEKLSRDSSGGVISYINNISNYLMKIGFSTMLIGSGEIDLENIKNKFNEFSSITLNTSISNFRFFLKLFTTKELKKIKKQDIIHVQRAEMVIPVALRTRNKIVCTLHGGQDLAVFKKKGKLIGLYYSFLQLISYLLVNHLIVVDKKNMERYITKYPWIKKKTSLIPIAIDIERFYPRNKKVLRKKYKLPNKEKIILFVGRLEVEKNVDFLIRSFIGMKNGYDCRLLIVGTGKLENYLQKLALPYNNKIQFYGEIESNLIPEIINCSDVLVLVSIFEGSPTVVKEALCCNVPIISTDVGDVAEVLQMTNGGEIIEFNPKSFDKAVDRILSNDKYNFSNMRNIFSNHIMGKTTIEIYEHLNSNTQ